jgi:antirestriction protein
VVPPDLAPPEPVFSLVSLAFLTLFSGVSNPSGGCFLTFDEERKAMSDEIRIYIADLTAYNNGKLHGVWINACGDINDVREQIKAMLAVSPEGFAEEYAIHDYEGFGGYALREHEGIETAHEIACFITEYPDFGGELLNHFGGNLEEAKAAADDNYCGCYKSPADYAQELTEETSQLPERLTYYIDYERMGRDMEMGGDIFTIETGFETVHLLWSR